MANWSTQEIFAEIIRRCASPDAAERVALCTVVATRGSCPQSPGAKMIVLTNGKTIGTLGGGCVEAEVRNRAMQMLVDDKTGLLEFDLNHDYGWDDGLICGGSMDIFVQPFDGSRLEQIRSIVQKAARHEQVEIRIPYVKNEKACEYVERIEPPPTLLIVGAGHVAQALAAIAGPIGFDVAVMDDRSDYVSAERFPQARQRITGDIDRELSRFAIDPGTFIVIVTRGHNHDGAALARVIHSPAKYIGMIGSKRKIKAIYDELTAQGVSVEQLLRVHAPIGLDIGAVSVQEIAISIAADLVAVKRGAKLDTGARVMKMDADQVRSWLTRDKSA